VSYDPGYGGLIALFVGVYVGIIVFALAIGYVLTAIGYVYLFRKVGVETWIAWVPFYNTWKFLEVGSQPGWISILSIVPVGNYVVIVFRALAAHRIGISLGKDSAWVVLEIFFPWLWGIVLGVGPDPYDPGRLQAFGYPPPYAGHGAVPPQPSAPPSA